MLKSVIKILTIILLIISLTYEYVKIDDNTKYVQDELTELAQFSSKADSNGVSEVTSDRLNNLVWMIDEDMLKLQHNLIFQSVLILLLIVLTLTDKKVKKQDVQI